MNFKSSKNFDPKVLTQVYMPEDEPKNIIQFYNI